MGMAEELRWLAVWAGAAKTATEEAVPHGRPLPLLALRTLALALRTSRQCRARLLRWLRRLHTATLLVQLRLGRVLSLAQSLVRRMAPQLLWLEPCPVRRGLSEAWLRCETLRTQAYWAQLRGR